MFSSDKVQLNMLRNLNFQRILQQDNGFVMDINFDPNGGKMRRELFEKKYGKHGELLIQQFGNGGIKPKRGIVNNNILPTLTNGFNGLKSVSHHI